MTIITTPAEFAAHVGACVEASNVTMTRDSTIMSTVTFHWDAEQRLVTLRAPVAASVFDGIEPRAVTLRVSTANRRLEVMGLELGTELAFVSHAFFDGDGVPAAAIDRLVQAIADCERVVLEEAK